jgi:rare lipoprotein A
LFWSQSIYIGHISIKERWSVLKAIGLAIITVSCIFQTEPCSANASDEYFVRASYYVSGTLTASGERFDKDGFTAASRTLPFGARLRVTNPATNRSVIVRINDRGPFVRGRALDLAKGAADAIGLVAAGTAMVKIARL